MALDCFLGHMNHGMPTAAIDIDYPVHLLCIMRVVFAIWLPLFFAKLAEVYCIELKFKSR